MDKRVLKQKHRRAGLLSAITKGPVELKRAADMAAWTARHGKDDSKNPFSKQNFVSLLEAPSIASALPDVDDFDSISAPEGRIRIVQHRLRERNRALVLKKRHAVHAATGALACIVCGFDFAATYGLHGDGFCEVHHTIPLSALDEEHQTRLEDLVIICSNCHRMIHRTPRSITVDKLRSIIGGTA